MQLPKVESESGKTIFPHSSSSHLVIPELHLFIPENSVELIQDWFKVHSVHLRVSKARSSKFGDYRPSVKHFPARISVNQNLNKFDFLITLVHEMAHHEVWIETSTPFSLFGISRKKRRPRPHGKEWKNRYQQLMNPLMRESIFPEEVLPLLVNHFENPRSSSKSNFHLVIALKKYDAPDDSVFIESLNFNTEFSLPAGRTFRKQEKLRKRYRCICLDNGKTYLFSPLARVVPRKI
jgi:hypothetical protein